MDAGWTEVTFPAVEDCWDEELSRFGQGKSCRPGIGIDTVSGAYVITRQIGLIRLSLLLFADEYRTFWGIDID